MSLELKFKLTFDSDYHVSAGHGLGAGVDSALLRDADGVPVIRGTTLTGLFRDGLWRLLQTPLLQEKRFCQNSGLTKDDFQDENEPPRYCGQDQPAAEKEVCPICRLFGTPRDSKRWFVHSARPEDKIRISTRTEKRPHGAIVQRVRISPRTRRAESGKLFSQEDGNEATDFIFSITCPVSNESALDEAALWVAAARNVRELGRSRNRGQGSCLFSLIEVNGVDEKPENWQTVLLDRFHEKWLKGGTLAPREAQPVSYTPPEIADAEQKPLRVRLILRTDEPLLIAERSEAGNMFDSRGMIPGATIRGALAWLVAQRHAIKEGNEVYEPFVETFLRGQVQFPSLYPAEYVNSRLRPTIPRPLDLFTCKTFPGQPPSGHGIWFGTNDDQVENDCPECCSALTNKDKGQFVSLFELNWEQDDDYSFSVKRSSEMHIQIDPHTRRVSEGQLFGYVALDAGHYFIGDLICQSEAAWKQLQALTGLNEKAAVSLQIGKANRRGYGKVTAWFEVIDGEAGTCHRLPLEKRNGVETELTMTLLTDTIVADTWGRYTTGFDRTWLEEELQLKIEKIGYAAAHTRQIDGFNAHLGLPRWRDVALTAGSSVHLYLAEPADLETLRELERTGIGLRTAEGFGQIAFNHPVYQKCKGITRPIKLVREMELKTKEDPFADFLKDWASTLDDQQWQKCSNFRFTAVARWLHNGRNLSPTFLADELRKLGVPETAWKEEYISDYGDRSKENKLQAEEDGINLIYEMLRKLAAEDTAFWPTGLNMLADRVTAVADELLQD